MSNIVTGSKCLLKSLLIVVLFVVASGLHAETSQSDLAYENQNFTDKINNLKEQVLELNQELFVLEEDLLFPLKSQVNIFISIDADFLFKPDLLKLEIDGQLVSNYLYTVREIQALHSGAVQRIYAGDMTTGKHELTATLTGKSSLSRVYKRVSTISITKRNKTQFIELKIKAGDSDKQPVLLVKIWE